MSSPYDPPQSPPEKFDSAMPEKGPPTKDNLTMAMLCHLLGALLGFLGPLIIWLTKKDDHPFVDDQGKESLNFQLTMLIVHVALIVVDVISCGLLTIAHLVPWVLGLIFGIIGATKANAGEWYRYPFNIRFIK